MKSSLCGALVAVSLAASSTWAALVPYPNKASLLAAIHADVVGISGLAIPGLFPTGRTAIGLTGNGRPMLIESNVGGTPRLISWANGIGAPNPANLTIVYTQGRPATAFGCYLRVANNLNQSVGGTVQIDTGAGSMTVNVPASGIYVAFTATSAFGSVTINALNGTLVEMIDDVLLADAAGLPASDHALEAGRAILGANPYASIWSTDDQMIFLGTFGQNYGNARDVWWTYTPAVSGTLHANTLTSNFDTLLSVYNGTGGAPANENFPIAMNDDSSGLLTSALSLHVDAGQVYYFRVGGFGGTVGSGALNLSMTPDTTCEADFNGDGSIDFFDYLDFVDAFSLGC